MPTTEERETAFAELMRDYENLWVALDEKDGERIVVGSGRTALEAATTAEANGFPDAVLFKVPSFSSSFIP
jgi:hypothetical protein